MRIKVKLIDLEWIQKHFFNKVGLIFQMEYYVEATKGFPKNFPRTINVISQNYYTTKEEK